MTHFLLVALGGAIGATARHGVGLLAVRYFGHGFPFGTLAVNIVGSLIMGLLIGTLAARQIGSESIRLFVATGLLGGFTTFSAFSLDVVSLWERGQIGLATGYVLISVFVSILALFGGLAVSRAVWSI